MAGVVPNRVPGGGPVPGVLPGMPGAGATTGLALGNLDQLPPTGAGRPGATTPDNASALTRSMRWRDPAPAVAAPMAGAVQVAQNTLPPTPQAAAASPALPIPRVAKTLGDELAEVQVERGRTSVAIAGSIGSRSGDPGLGQLDTVQTPIEGQKTIEGVGQLSVRVTPVVLSAGQVAADSRTRSGSLGLDTSGALVAPAQSDSGAAVAVALKTRTLTVDLGTTPVGFAVVDVVGGLRYIDEFRNNLTLTVDASRRAVTDSLLAFAGTRDARTDRVWGGVRSTGLRGQLAWEQADVGVYGYGGLHALTGERVASNSRFEMGAGSFWQAQRLADSQIDLGMNLGYQHYRRNLSGFTWGHGGYFSPQHLLSLTVPVNWFGRSGRLSWGLQGSAGVQASREDAAPYFPTDAAAQATMVSLVAQQRAPASSYAARSDSGLVLNLGGALEYQITRQLDIGTRLGLERAAQFTQSTGSIYLRFSLEPRGAVSGLGLQMPGGPAGF
jgi:hypothetical protein